MAACLGAFAVYVIVVIGSFLANLRQGMLSKQTYNDLKWIAHALHNYHDVHGSFPPVVARDSNGKPRHSWRSLIQTDLREIVPTDDRFDAYDLSQAWDHQDNQRSIRYHRFGFHPYQVLATVGPNCAWLADGVRSMSDFKDGTSNSILLIAVRNTGMQWHEPVDAVVGDSGSLSVNGTKLDLSRDVYLVTADGSVTYRGNGIKSHMLAPLLTIDAGDPIHHGW